MKKLLVLPTWVLVGLLRPFLPKDHAWKEIRFTLSDWYKNTTGLNIIYSIIIWLTFYDLFLLIYIKNTL